MITKNDRLFYTKSFNEKRDISNYEKWSRLVSKKPNEKTIVHVIEIESKDDWTQIRGSRLKVSEIIKDGVSSGRVMFYPDCVCSEVIGLDIGKAEAYFVAKQYVDKREDASIASERMGNKIETLISSLNDNNDVKIGDVLSHYLQIVKKVKGGMLKRGRSRSTKD